MVLIFLRSLVAQRCLIFRCESGFSFGDLPVYFLYLGEQSSVQLVKDSVRMLMGLWRIRENGRKGVYLHQPPGLQGRSNGVADPNGRAAST